MSQCWLVLEHFALCTIQEQWTFFWLGCCHRNDPEAHMISRKPWLPCVIRLITQRNGFPLLTKLQAQQSHIAWLLFYQHKWPNPTGLPILKVAQEMWFASESWNWLRHQHVARNIFLSEGLNCLNHWWMSWVQIQHWRGQWRWPDVSIEVVHRRQQPSPPDRLNSLCLLSCGCNLVWLTMSHVFLE